MAKKVYAIKEGYDSSSGVKIENKIVGTWGECLKLVKGVKGAKYKSFEDINEAKKYLEEGKKLLKKGVDSYPEDLLQVYVDGSYNIATGEFAYGVVALRNNIIEHIEGVADKDTSGSNIRQIAGELLGAIKAVEYALSLKEKKVVLFHDYEGIFHHATGSWDRKDESSKNYFNTMNALFNKGIEVIFVKVDSHTGDLYNELADEICKKNLDITSDRIVEKYLKNNTLFVKNEELKERIKMLVGKYDENIIVSKDMTNIKEDEDIIEEILGVIKDLPLEKQKEVLKFAKESW